MLGSVWAQQTSPAPAPPQPAPAKIDIIDEAGRHLTVPANVRRIVSLAPNLTETIYALGAQDRLVGVTDFCDFPPEAKQKTKVGGGVNPSVEQIVALKPDLVLAAKSMNRKETVEALEQLGIPVYGTAPVTVEDVIQSVRRIGEAIGAREAGDSLSASLRARLDALKEKLAARTPRRALFVVWVDPLITIGRQTFLADALRLAGAESVVDLPQEWPRIGLEEVVKLQPEYLIFADSHSDGADLASARARELAERPGWRGLDAVRERRIAVISDAVNRPAPRLIDAIEQLARLLHPDAFVEKTADPKEKTQSRLTPANADAMPAAYPPVSGFPFPLPAGGGI